MLKAIKKVIKTEKPKVEKPKVEKPKVEKPKVEKLKVEKPKVEKVKVEKPKVEKLKVEKPKVEKVKVEKPKVEKPKVEKVKVEKPKVKFSLSSSPSLQLEPQKKLNTIKKEDIINHLTLIRDYEKMLGNTFKSNAYSRVLVKLNAYSGKINNIKDFVTHIGAGERITAKVNELYNKGEIEYEEKNIKQDTGVNFLLELKKIHGIGPVKILQIKNAGIKSIEELKANPQLLNAKQLIGLQYYKTVETKIPIEEYEKHKSILEKELKKLNLTYEFVGSYRRGSKSMGDIDILIKYDPKLSLSNYVKNLVKIGYVKNVLSSGKVKFSGMVQIKNEPARQLDILIAPENEYYYSLLYFTGSAAFNVGFREYVKKRFDISLSEHGFNKECIAIPEMNSEEDIFKFLGIRYVEPIKRKIFFTPQK